jgi:hypothetical protein
MSEWLKVLLGVEDKDLPEGAVTAFEFANLPRGGLGLFLLVCGVALVAGVFWVYRREGSASPRIKYTLATLRALVFACAFVLILEPVLTVSQVDHVDKTTVVLVDDSLSMVTQDRYSDAVAAAQLRNAIGADPVRAKRYKLVNAALKASDLGSLLSRQNEVRVFRFSDRILPLATLPLSDEGGPVPAIPDIDPETDRQHAAAGTNLSAAVRTAVEEVGSDRIAAIILITDGRATLGPPPQDIAIYLKNKDLRLHTVVVGEAEPPRNLRVIALAGPDRIYRNDPVKFDARVSGRGYGGATAKLERRYSDGSDDWQTIDTQTVVIETPDQPVALQFADRPPRVGTVEYRLAIEEMADEVTTRDNAKTFVTRVVDEKARVLVIAGGPSHEYYAIKNVLLRDRTITVSCFLQSADPEFPQDGNDKPLTTLPESDKDLFKYDVVILTDPNGTLFPPDFRSMLRRFSAEHGGGLCFVAGNKHTLTLLRGGKGEDNLAGVLPVVLDLTRADTPIIGIGYGGYFDRPWRMVPDPAAFTHPTVRFHSDPRRARELVWNRLPPLYWFFPVQRAKPGATVLARHEDPRETVEPYGRRPIIAVHRYGRGNVMFIAADETHRWRANAEPVFDRFWVQTVRFLVEGRHAGARRRFRIYVDREVVDFGDAVQVSAEVFDEHFKPLEADEIAVSLTDPKAEDAEIKLRAVPGKQGHFSGTYAPANRGEYALRPALAEYRPKEGPDTPSATFLVIDPDREMGDVRADAALLKALATRTRGMHFGLHQLEELGGEDVIPPASERVVTQGRPVALWDTWTTITIVLLLLCAEWILRKKFRMV